jgi:hypothetical protein
MPAPNLRQTKKETYAHFACSRPVCILCCALLTAATDSGESFLQHRHSGGLARRFQCRCLTESQGRARGRPVHAAHVLYRRWHTFAADRPCYRVSGPGGRGHNSMGRTSMSLP